MLGDECERESLVAEALLLSRGIGHAVIEVKDSDGTITLKGTVESEEDRFAAETLAQEQEGVKQVVNQLKISRL